MWFMFSYDCNKIFNIKAFNVTRKVWSSHGLYYSRSLPFNFLIFNSGFHILSALMGSRSFVKSFVAKNFHLGMIFNLFMLAYL
jgi:hypothetical protein